MNMVKKITSRSCREMICGSYFREAFTVKVEVLHEIYSPRHVMGLKIELKKGRTLFEKDKNFRTYWMRAVPMVVAAVVATAVVGAEEGMGMEMVAEAGTRAGAANESRLGYNWD